MKCLMHGGNLEHQANKNARIESPLFRQTLDAGKYFALVIHPSITDDLVNSKFRDSGIVSLTTTMATRSMVYLGRDRVQIGPTQISFPSPPHYSTAQCS